MIKYPQTRKDSIVEEHFGIKVADPYRWLEDDKSPETMDWVRQQQAVTVAVLNEYPGRKQILERLKELNDYPKQGCPRKMGDWYYILKNDGLQNQWVTYRKRTLNGEEELFLDPNKLSEDGTTGAYLVGYSKDFKYFVYMISTAGSDNGEIKIMETESKTWLADKLPDMKHTGAAWYKNGFFYSRYDSAEDYQKQDKNQKIYYHKLGDAMANDQLYYEDPEHPLRFAGTSVSDDERYIFIHISEGTHGTGIIYKRLDEPDSGYSTLFAGFEFECYKMDAFEADSVYLVTNKGAKNYRLLKVDLLNPAEENWQEIIPEREYLLDGAAVVGHKIIAFFTKDVQSRIDVMDLAGNFQYEIKMPYQGTANFIAVEKEDTEGFFYFSSYVHPDEAYHYDIPSNKLTFFHADPIKADFSQITSEQVFYPSQDGTKIPLTLIYNKGIVRDGRNPVYLYGYGGFNYALMPTFSGDRTVFLEKGGIYAIANLRGGNEYGETWHEAGMLHKKQNVFDDFISAAEYLIKEKYTNPAKLAIAGGSNGGLLIGACMLQRPDLFRVAVPSMGVLDMLRYHKFTCGWGWMTEYGNPDEEEHFHNLLSYSPLHNVKEGVQYPATMVVTADHDDRVIPGHSFKFAATLQSKAASDLPLLLYTQIQSAHGYSNTTKRLELIADTWTFIFKFLDI